MLMVTEVQSKAPRVLPSAPPVVSLGRIRKVGLLGSHHSLEYTPWDDPTWELWGHASSRHFYKRLPERYFDLHRKACWVLANKQDRYMKWLKRNTVPIYMQEVDPDVPASVRYPKERVLMEFRRYFTSHSAYMIALALMEGVTHIGLFGINYSGDSEYATQRGSAEYWLGFAEARGVHLIFPPRCTLLSVPAELYGYESHDEKGRLIQSYRPKKTTIQTATGTKELTLVEDGQTGGPQAAPPPDHISKTEIEKADEGRKKFYPRLCA